MENRLIETKDQTNMRGDKKQIIIIGSRRLYKKQRDYVYEIIFKCLELQRGQVKKDNKEVNNNQKRRIWGS